MVSLLEPQILLDQDLPNGKYRQPLIIKGCEHIPLYVNVTMEDNKTKYDLEIDTTKCTKELSREITDRELSITLHSKVWTRHIDIGPTGGFQHHNAVTTKSLNE